MNRSTELICEVFFGSPNLALARYQFPFRRRQELVPLGQLIEVEQDFLGIPGLLKTYNKPFNKTSHEALTAKDLVWIRWKDGKLLPYSDALIGSLAPADFKQ